MLTFAGYHYMQQNTPLFHKPKSIIAAKNILFAAIFLGFLDSILAQLRFEPDDQHRFPFIVIAVLTALILYILTRQIGLGYRWARTIFLILFILELLAYPFTMAPIFRASMIVGFLRVVITLLQLLALVFLYSNDSRDWFNRLAEDRKIRK